MLFGTQCTIYDCIYLCILKIHLYSYIYKKGVYKFNQKSIFYNIMHVEYKSD